MKRVKKGILYIVSIATVYSCNGGGNVESDSTSSAKNHITQALVRAEESASSMLKARLTYEREFINRHKLNFVVTNTAVSELNLKQITGARRIEGKKAEGLRAMLNRTASAAPMNKEERVKILTAAALPAYDDRTFHLLPDIRFQKCGNCWAYSAICILECSYIKNHAALDPFSIDLSEQQLVDCSNSGDCYGGWPYQAIDFLKNQKTIVMNESDDPDAGMTQACKMAPSVATIKVAAWGAVDSANNLDKLASIASIKNAIVHYGAISACILATPTFQDYGTDSTNKNYTFKEQASDPNNIQINHAVTIVGWDDSKNAWLIRNSWGKKWGYGGYGWVDYNTNNIGYGAIWCISN